MSEGNQPNFSQPPSYAPPFKPESKTSGLAIASLILGFLSLVLSCLTGIVGVILGIIALVQIGNSNGRLKGTGFAVIGIVLSAVLSLMLPLMVALLLPAVQSVRSAARGAVTLNNVRQLVLAQHNYSSTHSVLPGTKMDDQTQGNGLSWRVHILPYLEQTELYDQFHLDEPWDSPHNQTLIPLMPEIYRGMGGRDEELLAEGETVFLRPIGNGAFPMPGDENLGNGIGFDDITDGLSSTILVVEADASQAVVWTKPDGDYLFDPFEPKRGLGGQRPSGLVVGYADGSVESPDLSPSEIRPMFTISARD